MSVGDSTPGFLSGKGRAAFLYYLVPVIVAGLLSFLLVTWAFMLVGASVWTVAGLGAFLGAGFAVFMQEVVYDVQ